jgi:putative nucleotidyltransferase with HDIG domain
LAWLRDERNMSAVLVMGAFIAVAATLVSWSSQLPREFVGQRVDVSRVNRLEYRDVDETATRERREEARKAAPLVYTANTDYLDRMRGEIEALPLLLRDKPTLAEVPATVVERYGLGEASFRALKELDETDELDQWKRWTDRMVANLTSGVPLVAPAEFEAYSTAARRMVVIPPRADLPGDRARSSTLGRGAIELRADDPAPMRARLVAEAAEAGFPMELARVSVGPILAEPRATVAFDSGATKIAADDAADAVAPTVRIHARGETVFTPGDTLTSEQVAMAADEQHRNSESRGTTGYLGSLAEAGALALALALLLSVYLAEHEPALFRNWQRLAALLAIALLPLALTAPVSSIFPRALLFCLVGSGLLATGVITIVFGLRVSLLAILLQGVLAIFALHPPAGVFLATLASSVAFAIALRAVRHRSTLVTAALASGAAAGIAVILAGISNGAANGDSVVPMLGDALVSVVTAFFVGFLVIGLLSTIERLFSVTTGLTLGELRDPKQPLLRELQRRAPGTWNHSLQVANIAEAAAESIGADGLLTYVGALYHDIGKVNKPEYFVENQTGINRHERLSPAMSLLVIVGHVKDGMELAAEYRLPRSVRHFIESHHGTTLMEYFFHAAQRKAGDDELNEADFRYPGPKPRTREAAVLMLCDCVESASRTLSEPTPARIEQLVRDLSHKRLVDGQFDDSPLTLRELRSVEDSVIKSLNAIYHGRISYPSARSDQRDQRGDQPMPRVAS